jgi:hypothetical protein
VTAGVIQGRQVASGAQNPLLSLDEEDLNMVAEFVLVSGSIKDLAAGYGVSYPTMRQRLDRLIERLRQLVAGRPVDPLNDYLADLLARGQITPAAARRIRQLHREGLESSGLPSRGAPHA